MLLVVTDDIKGHIGNNGFLNHALLQSSSHDNALWPALRWGTVAFQLWLHLEHSEESQLNFNAKKKTSQGWSKNTVACFQISGMNVGNFLQQYWNKRCFAFIYVTDPSSVFSVYDMRFPYLILITCHLLRDLLCFIAVMLSESQGSLDKTGGDHTQTFRVCGQKYMPLKTSDLLNINYSYKQEYCSHSYAHQVNF